MKTELTNKQLNKTLITIYLTVISVVVLWKLPEATKAYASRETETKLGEYIYIDDYDIIHSSRKCKKLNYNGITSTRNKIDDMFFYFKSTPIGDISFCPNCVSDEDYESITNSFANQIQAEADRIIKERKSN